MQNKQYMLSQWHNNKIKTKQYRVVSGRTLAKYYRTGYWRTISKHTWDWIQESKYIMRLILGLNNSTIVIEYDSIDQYHVLLGVNEFNTIGLYLNGVFAIKPSVALDGFGNLYFKDLPIAIQKHLLNLRFTVKEVNTNNYKFI